MTVGIYEIKIGDKKYIGKDTRLSEKRRFKDHKRLLEKGEHYNTYLQNAYNKYQSLEYSEVIEFNDDYPKDKLSVVEMFYIDVMGTYEDGYNLTLGGEGGRGIIVSEEERQNRSTRATGEDNPMSKLTNDDFYRIVELLKEGKTNQEIADEFNLHDRYVSLIRHKKRFKNLWKAINDYEPEKSNDQHRGLTKEQFIEVVALLNKGWTNADIERKYNLSSGTGSRIRNHKLYKRWWKECFNK